MAPWDEMEWFDQPKVTAFTVGVTPVTTLCGVEPRRAVLMIGCTAAAGANAVVCPFSSANLPSFGFALSQSVPPIIVNQKDYGSLVQWSWFGVGSAAGIKVQVVELLLKAWPQDQEPPDSYRRMMRLAKSLGMLDKQGG